jgi:hypothetical protein
MALVIGVSKGARVYIGNAPLTVLELRGYEYALVEVGGKCFDISDREAVEVYPKVLVSCGAPSPERLKRRESFLRYAERERQQRAKNLQEGALTQAQYDALPGIEEPYDLMPRLIFEAPRALTILRQELYESRVG